MGKHVILNCGNDTLRIDRSANAKICLEAREVGVRWEDANKLIQKGLPLIKEQRE
jgi:hypothetical protein